MAKIYHRRLILSNQLSIVQGRRAGTPAEENIGQEENISQENIAGKIIDSETIGARKPVATVGSKTPAQQPVATGED
jgi:hypothetical protein